MSNNMEKWVGMLNWSKIPEFGPIHKLDDDRFSGCYYLPETVAEVVDRIAFSIDKDYGFTNKTIVGEPGSGKTTFVYFLKQFLLKNGHENNFHIEILHLQRLVDEKEYKSVVEKRTLKILKAYFYANAQGRHHENILKGETISKEIVNKLEDFIMANRPLFKKKLIIIVDDIDETPEEIVEGCVRYLYSLLECDQVAKWLVLRATTLDHYNGQFLDWITTKFPHRIRFPRVDLHGILDKRITHDNPGGDNPFIPDLCHLMITTFGNDLRAAVHNSLSFLDLLPPPDTVKNNPKFVGQYFKMNFTKVMSQIGIFPNIYADSISHTVPLEKDVFLILSAHNRFEGGDLARLLKHYKNIYSNIHSKKYAAESYVINFDMDSIARALLYLVNHRLIESVTHAKDFYITTPRGESFLKFVLEKVYTEQCKDELLSSGAKRHPVFWDLASLYPDISVSRSGAGKPTRSTSG